MQIVKEGFERERYLLEKGINKRMLDLMRTVVQVAEETGVNGAQMFVCGGAVTSVFTGRKINDYDIYFTDKKVFDILSEQLFRLKVLGEIKNVVITSNAVSFKYEKQKYQLINVVYGWAQDIFDCFDFTINMGAYDISTGEFVLADTFLTHNAQRRLSFNAGTKYPICSLLRSRKYINRGYFMSGIDSMKLALAIQKLKIATYADLKDQLQGIDTAFLRDLTEQIGTFGDKAYDATAFSSMIDEWMNEKLDVLNGIEKEDAKENDNVDASGTDENAIEDDEDVKF